MDLAGIVNNIRQFLTENGDPTIAEKYRKYFKEGYDPYGVDSALLGRKADELAKEVSGLGEAMAIAAELVSSGKYEEGFLAIGLLRRKRSEFTRQTFEEIAGWFSVGIRNWAHVDGLAGDVVSEFLVRGIVGLEDIASWCRSEFRYQRRTVPVSLIKAVGNPYSPSRVIDAAEPLMTDGEKVVQQGMGWLLREIWKKHPEPVEELLTKYRQTGPRVIFQYATEKMSQEKKEQFRRVKES